VVHRCHPDLKLAARSGGMAATAKAGILYCRGDCRCIARGHDPGCNPVRGQIT